MRVVYVFGEFRMWGKIPEEKVGRPIFLVHPLPRLTVSNMADDIGTPVNLSLKKMEFDYRNRLDHDLVEYEFVGES